MSAKTVNINGNNYKGAINYMKKVISLILIISVFVSMILSACSKSIPYSDDCYNDVLTLVDTYKSTSKANEIKSLYKGFGTSSYKKESVEQADIQFETVLKSEISSLAEKYPDSEQLILFAYNYIILQKMQYGCEAMGIADQDNFNYSSVLDKYYSKLSNKLTQDDIDGFRSYILLNKVFDYKDKIPNGLSNEEIATIVDGYLVLYIARINLSTSDLNKSNYTSAYDNYSDAIDTFNLVLDVLERNPNNKDSFTKYDIDTMRETANSAKSSCKTAMDNTDDSSKLYAFVDYLDRMKEYYTDIKTNTKKYIN